MEKQIIYKSVFQDSDGEMKPCSTIPADISAEAILSLAGPPPPAELRELRYLIYLMSFRLMQNVAVKPSKKRDALGVLSPNSKILFSPSPLKRSRAAANASSPLNTSKPPLDLGPPAKKPRVLSNDDDDDDAVVDRGREGGEEVLDGEEYLAAARAAQKRQVEERIAENDDMKAVRSAQAAADKKARDKGRKR